MEPERGSNQIRLVRGFGDSRVVHCQKLQHLQPRARFSHCHQGRLSPAKTRLKDQPRDLLRASSIEEDGKAGFRLYRSGEFGTHD